MLWLAFGVGFLLGSSRKGATQCEACGGRLVEVHPSDRSIGQVWGQTIADALAVELADGARAWVQYAARDLRLWVQPPGSGEIELLAEIPRP